jgi:hypothetical protein
MFIHPNFSQFGSWVANQNSMYYASLIPSAFIRSLEDSAAKNALFNYNPAFFARLALRSRNSFDCLYSLLEEDQSESISSDSFDYSQISQRLEHALQASARQALDVTNSIEETADPTLLRLKSSFQFFVIGVFNPMGPTVQSLEAFPTEKDNEYTIAEVQRHPLYPSYLPMARVQAGSPEFSRELEAAVEKHFNWLPSYLDLAACPEEVLPEVTALIKKRLLQVAIEQKIDVAEYTSRLETLRDDAWSRVDHSLPDIKEATTPATATQIERHFELITSPENLALFWNSIPDAWDGSLNFSLGNGSLQQTYVGPLLWTYNRTIGASQ